jgi:hypothetical protein
MWGERDQACSLCGRPYGFRLSCSFHLFMVSYDRLQFGFGITLLRKLSHWLFKDFQKTFIIAVSTLREYILNYYPANFSGKTIPRFATFANSKVKLIRPIYSNRIVYNSPIVTNPHPRFLTPAEMRRKDCVSRFWSRECVASTAAQQPTPV